MDSQKIIIEALLSPAKISDQKKKEIAASMNLPENDQADLLYMSAILVSTGTNKNGAVFLASELIKARESISQKALDIEHEEKKIIGHITSAYYFDFDGNLVDDAALAAELTAADEEEAEKKNKIYAAVDQKDMEIGIICAVYRDRFPELAQEIADGEWKVSMECYFDDYDIKVGNRIISKQDLEKLVGSSVKDLPPRVNVTVGGKVYGSKEITRVLRGIKFCGVGVVKNPANERSIIIEAAQRFAKNHIEDSQPMAEAASVELNSVEDIDTEKEILQIAKANFVVIKNGREVVENSQGRDYREAAKLAIKLAAQDPASAFQVASMPNSFFAKEDREINEATQAIAYNVDSQGQIKEIFSYGENAPEVANWDTTQSAGYCVSFERFVYEQPGKPNPGKVVHSHWCKLYNKSCPVIGADNSDNDCLRKKYAKLTVIADNAIGPVAMDPVADATQLTVISGADMPQPIKPEPAPIVVPAAPSMTAPEAPAANKVDKEYWEFLEFAKTLANYKEISREQRESLPRKAFALQGLRRYPLHSKAATDFYMILFPEILKNSKFPIACQKEFFDNVIAASYKFGADCTVFSKKYQHLASRDFSTEYAFPRLELLPLESREQVIAAMSRFRHIKEDVSEYERKHAIVNIIKAAKKFDINCDDFRQRFLNDYI